MEHIKIVLICGPSGAGKDTLLKEAKFFFKDNKFVNFVPRYITRPPDVFEKNFYICKEGFSVLKQNGFFLVTWETFGHMYGIPKHFIKNNCVNFISVSRTVIKFFENNFDEVYTIFVTADFPVIYDRLKKRNRENEDMIKQRLQRYTLSCDAKNKIIFKNQGPYEVVKENFISLCMSFLTDIP